ncbi:MAG: hypothetical protein COB04_12635 [Gammaproteobacteria bacterium]|nr:MAG: hypothetical protein COB04_12635 [Gammaproteobacteria bacterium]
MDTTKALRATDFTAVLNGRRSVRHFTNERVDDDLLKEIIEEAACSPSPGNSQEWEVVVLSHQQTERVIDKFEDWGWEYIFPLLRNVVRRSKDSAHKQAGNLNSSTHEFYERYLKVSGSPRLLLVCKRRQPLYSEWWGVLKVPFSGVSPFFTLFFRSLSMRRVNRNLKSAGLANITYAMTLSAYSKGLATCIQGVYCNLEKEVIAHLELERDLEIFLSVLIGVEDQGRHETPKVLMARKPVRVHWLD